MSAKCPSCATTYQNTPIQCYCGYDFGLAAIAAIGNLPPVQTVSAPWPVGGSGGPGAAFGGGASGGGSGADGDARIFTRNDLDYAKRMVKEELERTHKWEIELLIETFKDKVTIMIDIQVEDLQKQLENKNIFEGSYVNLRGKIKVLNNLKAKIEKMELKNKFFN